MRVPHAEEHGRHNLGMSTVEHYRLRVALTEFRESTQVDIGAPSD